MSTHQNDHRRTLADALWAVQAGADGAAVKIDAGPGGNLAWLFRENFCRFNRAVPYLVQSLRCDTPQENETLHLGRLAESLTSWQGFVRGFEAASGVDLSEYLCLIGNASYEASRL